MSQYQSRVIGPTEVVDYSALVVRSYPSYALQREPFIGFKVLCRDTNAHLMTPGDRMRQIDAYLGFMRGTGCLIRETKPIMPDGFWVITMPVPRSQVAEQLLKLSEVLGIFEQQFGIVRDSIIEINVSGRCRMADTEKALSGLVLPPRYTNALITPGISPYKLGFVVRINDDFMVLRTRWNSQMFATEELIVIAQLISSMYH